MKRLIAAERKPGSEIKCARCGQKRREHWSLSFCNGAMQSGEVLVCPTSVFSPAKEQPEKLTR